MKKFFVFVFGIFLLFLIYSGIFGDLLKFVLWLFTLQYSAPETTIAGSIIVRILTFLASYTLVGAIFKYFGWFYGKAMSFSYFIISSVLGFLFSYIVMILETHLLLVFIILGSLSLLSIAAIIFYQNRDFFRQD